MSSFYCLALSLRVRSRNENFIVLLVSKQQALVHILLESILNKTLHKYVEVKGELNL